jgi:[ribosomal protein S5]-alanine N-acetyltransferase
MDLNTIFETKRLILRPMNINDAKGLFSYLNDPEVMQFENSGVLTYKQIKKFLEEKHKKIMQDMLPLGTRAVVLKESGNLIGECTLHHLEYIEGHPVEVAYKINRYYWKNGYATEAAKCLMDHGYKDLKISEIVAAINPLNVASIRVAEKLGLTYKRDIEWPKQGSVRLYSKNS